jgi:hypothetical protein
MRFLPPHLIMIAWAAAPIAWSQAAAPQPAVTAAQHAATEAAAHPRGTSTRRSRPRNAARTERGSAAAAKPGVLALDATQITGNKELPKVMVIVPWKDSTGAGGVIKPTDSLMDEVLEPVDRGVFQRRIRYYGQLDAAGQTAAAGKALAPTGDSK